MSSLEDEPPLTLADGGVIRAGVDAALDELRDLSRNSKQYIAQIEQRERQRTGIGSLKVKFNSVFGYYLEISKANLHLAPADYERKQTLVNAERFTTPELKEYEAKVLDAQEKMVEIERRLFAELRTAIAAEARRIRQTALALAEIDVLASFAALAANRNYCRPAARTTAADIEIVEGRHPVIEQLEITGVADRFVPNDLYLNGTTHSILLITGPNMGGKSTYLRQAALIVLMAQMGSFVPARSARLGLVDRIFTRIGAADNLARGRSTFMVEMTETAAILNTATPRSLILLDEVGRGTATYDGLAIAWAAIEYIHANTRAKTLFATHYHELTELADRLSGVKNYHVAVKESGGGIVFLRKVEEGAADKSYGIEVAKLAGLPTDVVNRAREVLAEHESAERSAVKHLAHDEARESGPMQLTIFTPLSQKIVDRIKETDLEPPQPAGGAEPAARTEEADGVRPYLPAHLNSRLHALHSSIPYAFQTQPRTSPAGRPVAHHGLRRHRPCRRACASCSARCSPAASSSSSATSRTPSRPTRCCARRRRRAATPMFLCVDMEGGTVDRLRDVIAPVPSVAEVAAAGSKKLFRKHGRLIGEEVRALGFNTDFAPVLDLQLRAHRKVCSARARFRADPEADDRLRARVSARTARLRRSRLRQALSRAGRGQSRLAQRTARRSTSPGSACGRKTCFPIASCARACRS